jgi:twitching motility protein PilI
LQAGGARWLIDLEDAAEVIPVPPISSVPLARVWFKGVTNVRGNLYSVTDFFALLGGEALRLTADARLVLLSERFRCGAALLVERSLGLRALEGLEPQPADAQRRWVRARYRDAQGQSWNELDVPALVQDPDFLEVSL